jgi:acetyl esterase/lipase
MDSIPARRNLSFSHAIEDIAAAIACLRQSSMTQLLRLDPSRIVVIGHGMGGFMDVRGAAAPTLAICRRRYRK